ncbi:hypothetical protein CA13_36060 [Planctomycetes bacterium CA13]|uniref:RanBP2-type domain-containing protein n=1 Tax=Novipirellula herctigrandis TaxID=2527986 RepID=A0A5C5Z4L1_9BACT|nr:hypothetical protein CA13_36060 [Planctomycetes bacterium CA13]
MQQSRVVVRECADAYLAETIRIRLANEGISALITGTDPVAALGFGGAATNRLVRVEVAESDCLRAIEILQNDEQLLSTAGPWICSRCGEQNEPAFEVCWSCNKHRSDEDSQGRIAEKFDRENQNQGFGESEATNGFTIPQTNSSPMGSSDNPYAPPAVVPDKGLSKLARERFSSERSERIEEETRRVFYSSIIGLLMLPPLVNIYSLYLTLTIPHGAFKFPSSRRRLIAASFINGLSIASWGFVWLSQLDLL